MKFDIHPCNVTQLVMPYKSLYHHMKFHYELSGVTATDYIVYGIVLHEQEAEIEKEGGKLLLRG